VQSGTSRKQPERYAQFFAKMVKMKKPKEFIQIF
jgi:hypothetical protein